MTATATPSVNGSAPPCKPAPMPVIAEHVPEVLRRLKRWLVWSWIWKPNKNNGLGGWDKPPLSVKTGWNIDGTNPKNWTDFDTALRAHQRGDFDGIGIALGVLDNGLTLAGLDLDDALDPATGKLASWARYYLDLLNTYSEASPSGTGVKALAFGTWPPGKTDNGRGVEVYQKGHYFTVIGNRLDGLPADVQRRQEAMAKMYAIAFAETFRGTAGPSHLSDRDLALSALAGLNPARGHAYHD
jgi:primase-polymerase (primpol)-like protein